MQNLMFVFLPKLEDGSYQKKFFVFFKKSVAQRFYILGELACWK